MAKFNKGNKVKLTIKDSLYLGGFYDNDICIIDATGCGGLKEYCIRRQQNDIIGYAMEDELELVDPMEQTATAIINSIRFPKLTTEENPLHNHILTWDGSCDELCGYDMAEVSPTKQYMEEYVEKCLGEFKNKEKNYMKILEIYRREAEEKIENDYNNLVNKIIEEDKIQKLIQETENQINVILDKDEEDAICLGHRSLLEPKNKDKIKQLQNEQHDKKRKLDEFLEKVQARLEICDDTECSKAEVLMIYGILDEEGKIAEYKIEKKGKK